MRSIKKELPFKIGEVWRQAGFSPFTVLNIERPPYENYYFICEILVDCTIKRLTPQFCDIETLLKDGRLIKIC